MGKIEGACNNAQDHIRLITDSIFEGVNSDMTILIPNSLQSMRETAKGCTQWSREIHKEFHIALNLLEEVHCSCHATQMTNQEKLNELERQKMALKSEKMENERNKNEKESRKKKLESEFHEELYKYQDIRAETERKIKNYQNEVEYKKNQLKRIKEEQNTTAREVTRAYDNRGWRSWMFNYKTSGIENAERRKSGKDEEVRRMENEVRTKERSVEIQITREKNILEEKRKAMDSSQNMIQGDIVKTTQNIDAISNKIKATIAKMNATDITKLDMEDVKNLLKEGIEQIAQLEGHWKNLILFFDAIGNITEIVLGKAIEDFTNVTETATLGVIEGSDNTLSNFRKKVIARFALETYSRCNAVGKVSKSYMMISKNHLMPAISDLSTIASLDSQRDAEKIAEKKKDIQTRCEKTVNYVKEVIRLAKLQSEIQVRMQAFQLK